MRNHLKGRLTPFVNWKEFVVFLAIAGNLIFTSPSNAIIGNMLVLVLGIVFVTSIKRIGDVRLRPIPALVLALFVYWIFSLIFVAGGNTQGTGVFLKMALLVAYAVLLDNVLVTLARPVVLVYALTLTALVNLGLFFTASRNPSPFSFWGGVFDDFGIRYGGSFRQPNELGMCLAFAVFYLVWDAPREKWPRLSGRIALIGASFFLVMQTGSKLGVLLSILGLTGGALGQLRRTAVLRWVAIWATLALILTLGYGWYAASEYGIALEAFNERIAHLLSGMSGHSADTSTADRMGFARAAASGITESPLFGKGVGAFAALHGSYTHSTYLEVLYNGGLVAFLLYYGRHACVLLRASRLRASQVKTKTYVVLALLAISDFATVSLNLTLVLTIIIVMSAEIRHHEQFPPQPSV